MRDLSRSRPLIWVSSSRKDLKTFPAAVQRDLGHALHEAQQGGTPPGAKPLKGFSGASVMEIVADHRTDTYRGVYTARFGDVVFVLHAFQKKSKHGIATPRSEIELIRRRLREAEEVYEEWKQT